MNTNANIRHTKRRAYLLTEQQNTKLIWLSLCHAFRELSSVIINQSEGYPHPSCYFDAYSAFRPET